MKCIKEKQLRADLNITISKDIVKNGYENLSWSRLIKLSRLYRANQISCNTRMSSHGTRQSEQHKAHAAEGQKALISTKSTRDRCAYCGNTNHSIDECRGGCRQCDTFTHTAKDCSRRQMLVVYLLMRRITRVQLRYHLNLILIYI